MKLIIAEKSSVAGTIARVVGANDRQNGYFKGGEYYVTWCVGHLLQLAQPEIYNADYKIWKLENLPIIPKEFRYEVTPSVAAQYRKVEMLCNQADVKSLICATDAGREGELIFRLVYNNIGCNKPFERLWLQSMEESGIKKAFETMKIGSEYDNLYKAAVCRQCGDWLLGINFTRLYSVAYNKTLKTGRVQTPLVNLIVRRQKEIEDFVPDFYEILTADLGAFKATCRADNKAASEKIISKCTSHKGYITKLEQKAKKQAPPCLYDTSSLQRDANRILKYPAKKTLTILQTLYENKLLTYPRTESSYLTEDMYDSTLKTINNLFSLLGNNILSEKEQLRIDINKVIDNTKVGDHHAIIITQQLTAETFSACTKEETDILTLVMYRMLEAVYLAYEYTATKVWVDIDETTFTATGQTVQEQGFKLIDAYCKTWLKGTDNIQDKKTETKELPIMSEGNIFSVLSITSKSERTAAPEPYTDDTLLGAMETAGKNIANDEFKDAMKDKGLGTAATRADIIESVIASGYIIREKQYLLPTETADVFMSIVVESLKEPELTGEWEKKLADIEKGTGSDVEFMESIMTFIKTFVKDFIFLHESCGKKDAQALFQSENKKIGTCPKCGNDVIEGTKGYFCVAGKENCGFAIWKQVASKSITFSHVEKLLSQGRTDLIKGFKSKAGKNFNALLVMKEDKTIGFEFESRK